MLRSRNFVKVFFSESWSRTFYLRLRNPSLDSIYRCLCSATARVAPNQRTPETTVERNMRLKNVLRMQAMPKLPEVWTLVERPAAGGWSSHVGVVTKNSLNLNYFRAWNNHSALHRTQRQTPLPTKVLMRLTNGAKCAHAINLSSRQAINFTHWLRVYLRKRLYPGRADQRIASGERDLDTGKLQWQNRQRLWNCRNLLLWINNRRLEWVGRLLSRDSRALLARLRLVGVAGGYFGVICFASRGSFPRQWSHCKFLVCDVFGLYGNTDIWNRRNAWETLHLLLAPQPLTSCDDQTVVFGVEVEKVSL